jgi:hypothetical protein
MHRIFQEDPGVFARAFKALGIPFPTPIAASVLSPDATERKPIERRIDSVIRFETDDSGPYLLAVEAQCQGDKHKPAAWAYHASYLSAKHDSGHEEIHVGGHGGLGRRTRRLRPSGQNMTVCDGVFHAAAPLPVLGRRGVLRSGSACHQLTWATFQRAPVATDGNPHPPGSRHSLMVAQSDRRENPTEVSAHQDFLMSANMAHTRRSRPTTGSASPRDESASDRLGLSGLSLPLRIDQRSPHVCGSKI